MGKATRPVPDGYHTITAQLTIDNAAQAIDWYKRAFGATEVGRSLGPDGKIMHAEIRIGDSPIVLNDAMQDMKGPKALGGSPAALWLYVDNSDEVFKRATAAGATVKMPMDDQFWGDRAGALQDPAGYTWWIATHKEDLSRPEIEKRAQDFFKQTANAGPR